jgi:hypothetical protein
MTIKPGRWQLAVLMAFALLVAASINAFVSPVRGVSSFNIVLQFDQTGDAIDPCVEPFPTCGEDADLAATMIAAAQHWEDIIEDDHEILISFRWVDESDPSASIIETDAAGRPTEALIRIPANRSYFYDSTPHDDDEFDMQARLYRTVHPDEKVEAFQGAPLEIFEVAYIGKELDDDQSADILSIVLHEMGHSLGLADDILEARPVPACTEDDDPYYHLDPDLTGGADFALKAFIGSGDFDCAHLALGGITACKPPPGDQDTTSSEPSTVDGLTIGECTSHQALLWVSEYPSSRHRPGIADILAVATASGWEEINLPRKYSLAPGPLIWDEGESWLGGRVPDAGDDVYIVNQEDQVTVDSFDPGGVARNITITDGNVLNVFFHDFHVGEEIVLEGEGTRLSADADSIVHAFSTVVGEGSILDVPFAGMMDSTHIESQGEIRGGDGTIDVVVLANNGLIRGNGGLLTFTSSSIDDPFDLDGIGIDSRIEALVGDLTFQGSIHDPVLAGIFVGPGHFITFAEGWEQQALVTTSHVLTLTGGNLQATINGFSRLNGPLVVNQIGRFTDEVNFEPPAQLALSVGGLVPGSGHDQLRIEDEVDFEGELVVELLPAFAQNPNDRYTIVTYESHTGEFDMETLPALEGGLAFVLDYGATALDLVVGFAGGTPGTPQCHGQAAAHQAQEHGGMKKAADFHGYPSVQAFQDAIEEFCEG